MQGISAIQSLPRQIAFSHRVSLRTVFIAGFCLVALLLAAYVFQVVEYTKVSFSVSQYESQIAQINKTTNNLESSFSTLNSLPSLETLVSNMGYEQVGTIQYVQMAGNQVATNAN